MTAATVAWDELGRVFVGWMSPPRLKAPSYPSSDSPFQRGAHTSNVT